LLLSISTISGINPFMTWVGLMTGVLHERL
jgi:hypothetical protein